MSIGKILIDLRQEHGISQKQLATAIGISQSTIAKIEVDRNEATASTLRKLSDYFGVSTDYLLECNSDYARPNSVPLLKSHENLDISLSASMEISREEKEMLELFHTMSAGQKKILIAYAEGLLGVKTNSKLQRRKK